MAKIIQIGLVNDIGNYLAERPWKDVQHLLPLLANLPDAPEPVLDPSQAE